MILTVLLGVHLGPLQILCLSSQWQTMILYCKVKVYDDRL